MSVLCRDCLARLDGDDRPARCASCGGRRLVAHAELFHLSIAHVDCDAFYAAVEKRDDPSLRDKPVIVGGGRRGVVAAACYVARTRGVHSAMPMFKALKACPDAVVIRPDMRKYAEAGQQIRALMLSLTPLVEPLSIDEAFLDLSGTERLHGAPPAALLAGLARRVEAEIGVTVSIGLAPNKFLAKLASDMDKPRGFAVIGRAEAAEVLAPMPVKRIWGVGKSLGAKLARDGLTRIGDLRAYDEPTLRARYGAIGGRLHRFAHGQDDRPVSPGERMKSVSSETTFEADLGDAESLARRLWPLCESVAGRLKRKGLAGRSVTLKLKNAGFRTITRSVTLSGPVQFAEPLYQAARPLLARAVAEQGGRYRLIGVGVSALEPAGEAPADLLDPDAARDRAVEATIDRLREKLGPNAIGKGRGL